jgi:hypothetical protein
MASTVSDMEGGSLVAFPIVLGPPIKEDGASVMEVALAVVLMDVTRRVKEVANVKRMAVDGDATPRGA